MLFCITATTPENLKIPTTPHAENLLWWVGSFMMIQCHDTEAFSLCIFCEEWKSGNLCPSSIHTYYGSPITLKGFTPHC